MGLRNLLILVLVWCCCSGASAGIPFNALKPQGEAVTLELARDGHTAYVIAVPENASAPDRFAAGRLREALRRITGAEFPVVTLSEAGDAPKIGVGLPLTEAELAGLGSDGYRIAVKNGDLLLNGGSRQGTNPAVSALLNEDLGCRYYSRLLLPVYPTLPTLELAVVPRQYRPQLDVRTVYSDEARDADWIMFNRASPITAEPALPPEAGENLFYPSGAVWFAHTFQYLAPDAALLKTEPELFALIDGRRAGNNVCLTNPRTAEIVAEKAIRVLEAHPDARLISISQNDGTPVLCRCPACQAMAEAEGAPSGPLLYFVNAVAKRIRARFPDVKVSTLAYLESYAPPARIRPDDGVVIFLATDRHAWKQPFRYLDESTEFLQALDGWAKIAPEIHIWDYVFGDNANWLLPCPNFDVVARNLALMTRYPAVKGMFFQDNFQSVGSARGAMKNWILTQLAWNPALDVQALERDYTLGAFGAAGPAMQEYNDLLRAEWRAWHDGPEHGMGCFSLSDEAAARAATIFDRARAAARTESVPVQQAVEREAASLTYRRLKLGPVDDADREAYLTDLDRFQATCKTLGIRSLSEGELLTAMLARMKAELFYRPPQPSTPDSVILTPMEALLPAVCGAAAASVAADAESPCGVSLYQPCPFTHWSIQWHTKADKFQQHPGKWRIRLRVKCAPFQKTGPVMIFGVYTPDTREYRLQKEFGTAELSDREYRWVEVGTIELKPEKLWFYAGPTDNSACPSLNIEYVELTPVTEP